MPRISQNLSDVMLTPDIKSIIYGPIVMSSPNMCFAIRIRQYKKSVQTVNITLKLFKIQFKLKEMSFKLIFIVLIVLSVIQLTNDGTEPAPIVSKLSVDQSAPGVLNFKFKFYVKEEINITIRYCYFLRRKVCRYKTIRFP